MNKIIKFIIFAVIILLFASCFYFLGYRSGTYAVQGYKTMAIKTCEYSVTLTELANNQLSTIELCNSSKTYERLPFLNCSLIK